MIQSVPRGRWGRRGPQRKEEGGGAPEDDPLRGMDVGAGSDGGGSNPKQNASLSDDHAQAATCTEEDKHQVTSGDKGRQDSGDEGWTYKDRIGEATEPGMSLPTKQGKEMLQEDLRNI